MMFLFFTMWSLFASPLAAVSRDFSNLVKSIITAIFLVIRYSLESKNYLNWLVKKLLMLNPITYLVQGYRNTFLYKQWFFENFKETLGFFAVLAIMALIAVSTYKKLRKEIPDVL